jgi:cytochrome c oxidase assembly protein subunit 15
VYGKQQSDGSVWPHRLAVLLVCATFPLIWVGGLVTTYEAGMAVPDWPTTYGYNPLSYPWATWWSGPWDLFIEHGHRLLAGLVMILSIVVCGLVWMRESRAWVRWMAVAAVGGVLLQALLGGLRVVLDERLLAKIHACVGPAFFALTVALAAVTSRWWSEPSSLASSAADGTLRRMTAWTALLAYLQLVIGAQLRHVTFATEGRVFQVLVVFHIFVAVALVGHVYSVVARVLATRRTQGLLLRPALGLTAGISLQFCLGIATWVVNYGWPVWFRGYSWSENHVVAAGGLEQSMVTTAHVAIGSMIIATATLLTLRTWRLLPMAPAAAVLAATRAMGVAT